MNSMSSETAAKGLEIVAVGLPLGLGDPAAHVRDVGTQLLVGRPRQDCADLPDDPVLKRGIAGDRPRTAERHALPCLRFACVIGGEGIETHGKRSLRAPGTQAQIDFVEASFARRRGQRGDEALRQPRGV